MYVNRIPWYISSVHIVYLSVVADETLPTQRVVVRSLPGMQFLRYPLLRLGCRPMSPSVSSFAQWQCPFHRKELFVAPRSGWCSSVAVLFAGQLPVDLTHLRIPPVTHESAAYPLLNIQFALTIKEVRIIRHLKYPLHPQLVSRHR